jgi:hypothetical protein
VGHIKKAHEHLGDLKQNRYLTHANPAHMTWQCQWRSGGTKRLEAGTIMTHCWNRY